jgi:hypothetical protein
LFEQNYVISMAQQPFVLPKPVLWAILVENLREGSKMTSGKVVVTKIESKS